MHRWTLDTLATTLFFLTIVLAAALSPMASDTWWQLRAGADMWASGRVLLTDTYSHTAAGAFWPNHEWLSQVIFFGVYRLGGLPLLSLFAAALIVTAWIITWHLAGGPVLRRLAILLPALVPASEHWAPRPHAFSLLFLPLAVWLILRRRYFWLIPLFFVWANCHGGVLLGLVVSAAALAAALFHEPQDARAGTLKTIALALAGCVAAVTLTPLGLSFWTEIPRSLARIRQYPLDEWLAPRLSEIPLAPFWVLAAAFCVLLIRNWRRLIDPSGRQTAMLCLPALALLPIALSAVRNVGPFLMFAAPALCGLLPAGALAALSRPDRRNRPALNLALAAVATFMAVAAIGYAYRWQIDHLRWTPLPEASLRALRQCPDNLYNRYDEGGYLIWFEPGRRVFLDGRQDPYEPGLVLDQIRVETSGDYASTFSTHHIRCAYLPTTSPVAARLSSSGWSALYRDAAWVVLAQ
jgi:hypothetical protein